MKKLNWTIFFLVFFIFAVNAYTSDVEKKEEIKKTMKFSNSSGTKELEIDNINGSITVIGQNRDDVEILVHKKIEAMSKDKIKAAEEEIILDISEENNLIYLYVDAPYRKPNGSINYRGWKHYGYRVTFDYEINVPYDTDLVLKTINNGDIEVSDIRGNFEINNINGAVTMMEISGSGRAYALNEDTRIIFRKNPKGACYFGSLNGNVDVSFRPGLSADFKIKTFNGDAYTDFPMSYLPQATSVHKKENGKFVYKAERTTSLRVGNGGPVIELDGFNGDIRILER